MAFLQFLRYSILLVQISFPFSYSLLCTSQNMTNNHILYKNCIDLPTLNSYLHWTYDTSNSFFSIAFLSSTTPSGWTSWAINPSAAGMIGAQALIAFRRSDGTMSVKTYNISSYETVVESDILFNVSNLSAEYSHGIMKIFATLALPENTKAVNQLWQAGGSVVDGETPGKHDLEDANLNSKGKLQLLDHAKTTNATSGDVNGDIARHRSNSGSRSSEFLSTKVAVFVMLYSVFVRILDYSSYGIYCQM